MHGRPTLGAAALIALLGVLTGCSDPSDPAGLLTGAWIYSADFRSGSVSCQIEDMVLDLRQSAGSITGSYAGGSLICNGNLFDSDLDGGPVAGTFSEGELLLEVGEDWQTLDGVYNEGLDELTGSVEVQAGSRVLTGEFTAQRSG